MATFGRRVSTATTGKLIGEAESIMRDQGVTCVLVVVDRHGAKLKGVGPSCLVDRGLQLVLLRSLRLGQPLDY